MTNTHYIFVYGSLMGSIQSSIAKKLHENADFVGEGFVSGFLFDLGEYPGLIVQADAPLVKGHVFLMSDPEELIPALDFYEAINWEDLSASEYRRDLIKVQVADKDYACWAYLYNQPTGQLHLIPDGDYLTYLQNNDKHQGFLNSLRAN